MDLARFCDLDCGPAPSFLRLPRVAVCATGNLLQNVFREYTAATKFDSCLHQLKQNVLTFLTNGGYVLHIDKQASRRPICPRHFARGSEFCCPRANELAFHDQPALVGAIYDGDLQHALTVKATRVPNIGSCNFKDLQRAFSGKTCRELKLSKPVQHLLRVNGRG
jgi:hypothetical protein